MGGKNNMNDYNDYNVNVENNLNDDVELKMIDDNNEYDVMKRVCE